MPRKCKALCIPIDPFYLTWKVREYGLLTRFIELAGEVGSAMPECVVARLIVDTRGAYREGAAHIVRA